MINNPGAQGKPMQPVPGGWVDIGAQQRGPIAPNGF
jgi:hypothetical protein